MSNYIYRQLMVNYQTNKCRVSISSYILNQVSKTLEYLSDTIITLSSNSQYWVRSVSIFNSSSLVLDIVYTSLSKI